MDWRDSAFVVEANVVRTANGQVLHVRYRCPWCSNFSNVDAFGPVPMGAGRQHAAHVLVCQNPRCGLASLLLTNGVANPDSIYPNPQATYEAPGVPEAIAEDFEEALGCQAAGFVLGAAVVGRRVLQSALVDKGAQKYNLVDQINEIGDDVLPKLLKIASQQVRLIGNDAAHLREVSNEDAAALISFVQQVLYQMYTLPFELDAAAQKRTIAPQHLPNAKTPRS